jgi:hypothetical protein
VFIGHFALALGAKRVAPRTSLGTLVAAAQWCDLLWPALLLTGVERVSIAPGVTAMNPLRFDAYPISHSLLLVALWGVGAALLRVLARGDRRTAALLGLLVVSHWVLDLLVHRPDLPLTPWGATRLRLELWNHPAAEIAIEVLLFVAGAALYLRATRPRDARGRWGAWTLLAFLLGFFLMDAADGSPPPSWQAVALLGLLGGWVLVLWGWWADRHRTATESEK